MAALVGGRDRATAAVSGVADAAVEAAAAAKPSCGQLAHVAEQVRSLYYPECAFPSWSVDMLAAGRLEAYAMSVVVYYRSGDCPDLVRRLAREREPVNMGLARCYDECRMRQLFGYGRGAYSESSRTALMPNIAIYCRTPLRSPRGGEPVDVHVINATGYAFDWPEQPDYQYFFPLASRPAKWRELVRRMQQAWCFVFECARRQGLKHVFLSDIGGGAFSKGLEEHPSTNYARLCEESLAPVQRSYAGVVEARSLGAVPDWVFTEEGRERAADSLLVNAIGPWSLAGNGNGADDSLDGAFGRCTAMAVLCWPLTNPHLRYESVGALCTAQVRLATMAPASAPFLRSVSDGLATTCGSVVLKCCRPCTSAFCLRMRARCWTATRGRPPAIIAAEHCQSASHSMGASSTTSSWAPPPIRRSKALELWHASSGGAPELKACANMEEVSSERAKALQASGKRITIVKSADANDLAALRATSGYDMGSGAPLNELIHLGDVLKILRPAFDCTRIVNMSDHVMLVIQRPQQVAIIEVEGSRAGAVAAIGIFEIMCLESSNTLDFFERRIYWIVAHPTDGYMAIVSPDDPGKISEWERISVLTSPFRTAEPEATDFRDVEVVYVEGDGTSLLDDMALAEGARGLRTVLQVAAGGPAEVAGVRRGDLLVQTRCHDHRLVATVRPDPRRVRLDFQAFHTSIWEAEQQKLRWSFRTATRAVMRKARIAEAEYADEESYRRLASELQEHWVQKPICTTVPIRIWQRYLFLVWEGDDSTAAEEVLRLMPCRGDRALPSELWACLLETGLWSELQLPASSKRAAPDALCFCSEGSNSSDEAMELRHRWPHVVAAAPRARLHVYRVGRDALRRSSKLARRRPKGCHCSTM